jgi:PAS domain S-box-containing protein
MAEVNDWDKPKAQLIEELAALRAEVAHLRVKPEISPRGQSLSLAEGDRLLLAKGNGVSALRKDSSSASSNLAEASVPGMSPRCLLFDPLMPFQPEQVGYPFPLEHDCLQPEQLLSSFFNAAAHSNLGLLILDTELRFLRLNQALAEMNGFSIEAHLGQPLQALLPDLAPTVAPILTQIIETGESVSNLEISGYTPKQPDRLRHWLTALFPITNATGQVVAIGGSVREVTEFRTLLERLQEHEFNWKTAQRIAHVGHWQFDYLTHTVTWSEEVYRIHGCDPTLPPPQGEALSQYIHPDDRERFQQLMAQAVAGERFEMELRIIRPSGEIRHVEARGEPGVFDDQGQLIRIFGTLLDVTDRKQAEIALRRNEFALREAQKIAHVGHWHVDRVTEEIVWSEEVFRIHGLDPSDSSMGAAAASQFIHPDDTAMRDAMYAAALQGETSEADLRIIRPNGEVRYIEARCSPRAFNEQGDVVEVFGTVLDVTERKQVEAALRYSEANLARAQKIAKLGHWEYDLASQTCTWSDELYAIHQLDPSQPPPNGEAMDQLIHPDDLWIDRQQLKAPLLAGKPCRADLRIVRQDGDIRHVEARGEPIFDDKGNVTHWVGTLFDISDRKRIEEKLRRSEAEMTAILKAIPDMLIRMTKDGRRLSIMPGTLTPCQPVAHLQNQLVYETLPFHLAEQRMENIHKAIETRELQVYEYDILIHGVLRKEEARLIAINDNEALIIVRDITERHQVEQVKDEFISMVSHELRTPLTSIQVALSLLDEHLVDPNSEDGQNMIHVATEGVDRLTRLVNDILDLERLESGKLRIQKQPCQTQALINTATQEMQDLAKRANVTIATSGISQDLQADRDRIVQVLTNLLSNAIRFSNPGDQVWVSVEEWSGKARESEQVSGAGYQVSGTQNELSSSTRTQTSKPDTRYPEPDTQNPTPDTRYPEPKTPPSHHLLPPTPYPLLLFSVQDHGRGISPDKLESIFERFQQADASDSREKSGTGLGLTICQQIIQQHGGQIWVESTLGQGSTFYFTVPVEEESKRAREGES